MYSSPALICHKTKLCGLSFLNIFGHYQYLITVLTNELTNELRNVILFSEDIDNSLVIYYFRRPVDPNFDCSPGKRTGVGRNSNLFLRFFTPTSSTTHVQPVLKLTNKHRQAISIATTCYETSLFNDHKSVSFCSRITGRKEVQINFKKIGSDLNLIALIDFYIRDHKWSYEFTISAVFELD